MFRTSCSLLLGLLCAGGCTGCTGSPFASFFADDIDQASDDPPAEAAPEPEPEPAPPARVVREGPTPVRIDALTIEAKQGLRPGKYLQIEFDATRTGPVEDQFIAVQVACQVDDLLLVDHPVTLGLSKLDEDAQGTVHHGEASAFVMHPWLTLPTMCEIRVTFEASPSVGMIVERSCWDPEHGLRESDCGFEPARARSGPTLVISRVDAEAIEETDGWWVQANAIATARGSPTTATALTLKATCESGSLERTTKAWLGPQLALGESRFVTVRLFDLERLKASPTRCTLTYATHEDQARNEGARSWCMTGGTVVSGPC